MSTRLAPLLRGYTSLDDNQLQDATQPKQIAAGLVGEEWKLIEIVKGLQDNLISENDAVRSRGVNLLSQVVINLDNQVLDRQSIKVLTTFFTTKLADKPSLVSCTTALTHLIESKSFGTLEGLEVTRGIFQSINLKAHSQSIRHTVYVLLDSLMTHSRPALLRMKQEFVRGYCQLVEGEKDPRNLMISFGLIRVMLLEFEVEGVVEELFDVTFCYFPITFTPPKDDPYGITSEDLILSLRSCLSATPLFGSLALPLFLDKLQAASEKAKRQTLEALSACFPIYGASTSGEWAGRFSEALSIEVFHATETSIQDLALITFHSLFSTLYPDSAPEKKEDGDEIMVDREERIEGIAVQVVRNSLDELEEPEKSNAKPALRILVSLIAASNRLAKYVLSETLPLLLKHCQNPDDLSQKPAALSHIATLLSSLSPSTSPSTSPDSVLPSPLMPTTLDFSLPSSPLHPHLDTLLSLFTSSSSRSQSSPTRLAALKGSIALIKLSGFLSESQEIGFCVNSFNEILQDPLEEEDEVYDLALENLIVVSRIYPSIIEETTFPLLFSSLPTPTTEDDSLGETYKRSLAALAALSIPPNLFEILSLRLLSLLDTTLSLPTTPRATVYAHHLLLILISTIKSKVKAGKGFQEDLEKYLDNGFVARLLGMFVLPTLKEEAGEEEVAKDPRLLLDAGKVLGLILQRVGNERQATFWKTVDEAFQRGNVQPLLSTSSSTNLAPFSSTSPTSQQNLISLYVSLLLPLHPSVPLSPSTQQLIELFLTRSINAQNELQLEAGLFALASLVNKRIGKDESAWLETRMKEFWETQLGGSVEDGKRMKGLRVWIWVAKALIVRSDPFGYRMIQDLLELFKSGEGEDGGFGRQVAKQLGVIVEAEGDVLSKENHSVIRLLYKQRFFTFLLPKLVEAHKAQQTASTGDSAVYLIALSSLLQHLPKQLTLTELPKLLPLLITSLYLPDPILRSNVISTLSILVREIPETLEPSISSIALKTLKSATTPSNSPGSIKLRLASLEFLGLLPEYIPYLTLHPQKTLVLKELGVKAIDDPKKVVRKAAVDCRSKWFSYT